MTVPGILTNDDTARARLTDPLTSHAAADGTTHKRPHSWLLIERALHDNQPMTAQELVQYIRVRMGVWISESRTTTGVKELRDKGVITPAGTRPNPSGYHGTAYQLTEDET